MSKDCYLITGASAGLGERFAHFVAAAGHDVILVARRADRLEKLAAELRSTHRITATPISTDLSEPGAVARLMVELEQDGLTVTHLINNAGYGVRGRFDELDGPTQARIVDLNCRTIIELTHAVLPAMIAAKRGGVLNVASTAAFQPGPWMAVYYASKAFVLSFSEALHHELKPQGIHVTALCPGPTRTEFFDLADMRDTILSRFMAGKADGVVKAGLRALAENKALETPGALNSVIAGSIRLVPRVTARGIAASLQRPPRRKSGRPRQNSRTPAR